jgi:hypothetical protein
MWPEPRGPWAFALAAWREPHGLVRSPLATSTRHTHAVTFLLRVVGATATSGAPSAPKP